MADAWRRVRLLVGLQLRADPAAAAASFVLQLVSQLNGVAAALALRIAVEAVGAGDRSGVHRGLAILVVGITAALACGMASYVLAQRVRERVGLRLDQDIARMTAAVPDIEHLERPEDLDVVELLGLQRLNLTRGPEMLTALLVALVRIAVTVALLGAVDRWLLLLPVFGLPSVWTTWRANSRGQAAWRAVAPGWRMQFRLFQLGTSEPAGRELRVFGAREEIARRMAHEIAWTDEALQAATTRSALEKAAGWAVFGAAFAAGLALLADRAVAGRAGAGDVVLAVALATQLNTQLGNLVGTVAAVTDGLGTAGRYLWLERRAVERTPPPERRRPAPAALQEGIAFEGVSFAYPGTDHLVLEDVDLHLPAGATVAIVGENGAGKSTLVKLLTRLHEPTSGRILVEGAELAAIDPVAWRARVSAAFQDHVALELLLQHVVGIGDLPRVEDRAAVGAALRAAGAEDVPADLPDGQETQLGRQFGGSSLSGGQWQKLAVGRALLRDEPLLLVLDEPTAAIDAATEAALFERYAGAAREARAHGGVTVLVSHRFSTVRLADLIVVLSGSRVAEVGSHSELVARGGIYAELYDLQASSYR